MSRFLHFFIAFVLLLFVLQGRSQTVLYPGDIIVLSMISDMGPCGLPPGSDEISFMCFQDIENGTQIDITDNGWEHSNANFFGDSEGTLAMSRTGGTIPKGTVITFQSQFIAGAWTYRAISPDNQWTFSNLNVPGGFFNLDPFGDQIIFMQGGTWDNQGGGANRATYNGRYLWGSNSKSAWAANGTDNESNIPPALLPCYTQEVSGPGGPSQAVKYNGPLTPATHFEWLERIKWWPDWAMETMCTFINQPWYPNHVGATYVIEGNMSLGCWVCSGCATFQDALIFNLPWDGDYNVIYTNGVDTFEMLNVNGTFGENVSISHDTSFWMVSVELVGGCTVYSNLGGPVMMTAPYNDPGEHGELWVCPNVGVFALWHFLEGTPEMGGEWFPPLLPDPVSGELMYLSSWGPGIYRYVFQHPGPPECPPDTASVSVHWINIDSTIIEVGCDQSGTPYDIFDDAIELTLTVIGQGLSPEYKISPYSGTITPTTGMAGVPETFLFSPGTATAGYMNVHITFLNFPWCSFFLDIPIPGYCSDPCDPDMETEISGDENICIKNCILEPGSMEIEINGGTPPYTMDFTISSPSYPDLVFTGVNVLSSGEFSVCVDTVAQPFFNAVTGMLTIPEYLVDSELSFTIDEVYDVYGCTGALINDQHTFYIQPLPDIDSVSIMVCRGEALNIDLTEYDLQVSGAYDVTWFDGNPWLGGEQIFNPSGANLENVLELWARVEDFYCQNIIQVPFIIFPEPDIDSIPPIVICEGTILELQSIPIVDLGNSMATYTFHSSLPPDSTNILDPQVYMPEDSTTIYLLATAGMCYDTIPIQIFVEDYPDFTLEGQPCDLLQLTYSVIFTSSADSIYASAGTVVNNVIGQDSVTGIPNNTNITIEIYNPTGLCSDTFAITAPNCDCPFINQPITSTPIHSICEGAAIPVMTVMIDPGLQADWYTTPSGGLPFLQNSLTYQPVIAVNSTYYVEAIDPLTNCYSIRTPIKLVVNPLAILGHPADPVLCDEETFNLSAIVPAVQNGVIGAGQWFDLLTNQPASGVIQPQNGQSWYYVFTSNPAGCLSRDTISAVVNPLPNINLFDIICDDVALTYQLSFTSDADVVLTSNGGTLVQVPGTDTFYLESIPFDTDIQFDLEYLSTGCVASFLLAAPDCSCPTLLQSNNYKGCSEQGNIDLSPFIGPGVMGHWEIVGTPAGSNPATVSGNNFLGFQKDAGTYDLLFIRNVILNDCVDSASFALVLQESPYADAGMDATVCAPDAIMLTGNVGGDNVVYNWQTSGTGVINNPGALVTSYTPTLADITSGSVSFTLSATDQTGSCPAVSETITITIDGSAYYILNAGNQIYCDTVDQLIDLDPLITFGTTSGEWFFPDTVSAPIIGSSQINPSTLEPGSYTIFYTTTNAVAPCQNDTTGVNLLIRNCMCPSVAIAAPGQRLCSESGMLNLNSLLLTGEPGTWSISNTPVGSSPAIINANQFITANSDFGIYTIRYTLNSPVPGCPDYSEVNLEVIQTPKVSLLSTDCADDLQSWEAVISTGGSVPVSNLGTVVPLGANQFRVEGIALNTSIIVSVSNGGGLCSANLNISNPDCDCTLAIGNLPSQINLCPDETIELTASVLDPKGNVTSFWIVANDSLYQNTYEVTQGGSYQFVAFDALGCRASQTVDVAYYVEMVVGISWLDVKCPGDKDGSIIIQDIIGGTGPFTVSVNGGVVQTINAFPYLIEQLGAGNYQLQIFDATNCLTETSVQIQSASTETLSLGADQTILVGDSVYINPVISFVPDTFYWLGDKDNLLQQDQLKNWIQPETDQLLQLFAIDENGCLYTDDLKIKVLLTSSVYVANVFSPNEDGINDILAPIGDPSITAITHFEIYSRWGELIYAVKNVAPNQGLAVWDGTLNGDPMLPGVYVYRVGAINKRGKEIELAGDVTLLR